MTIGRFPSADINPTQDSHVKRTKEQALQIIHQELTGDRNLRADAIAAIGNDYDGMGAKVFLRQLRTYCQILDAF